MQLSGICRHIALSEGGDYEEQHSLNKVQFCVNSITRTIINLLQVYLLDTEKILTVTGKYRSVSQFLGGWLKYIQCILLLSVRWHLLSYSISEFAFSFFSLTLSANPNFEMERIFDVIGRNLKDFPYVSCLTHSSCKARSPRGPLRCAISLGPVF
jgi:hypothetical protein